MQTTLDHCVIAVSDWERSNAFYRDVLGAEVVQRDGWFGFYVFDDWQLNVHGPNFEGLNARLPVQPGNSDLCFRWDGPIEGAIEHLERLGVPIEAGASLGGVSARPGDQRVLPRSGRLAARVRLVLVRNFVEALGEASIGATYNQYADSDLRRARLADYLLRRSGARYLLVGEAAGYRGARVSGLPFTSERQLTGDGPAEATATIVHRVLDELGLEENVLLWNVVPTHPGTETSNRQPTRAEVGEAMPFLRELLYGRTPIPVGRQAHRVLGGRYVRHPSHGGSAAFREGLLLSIGSCGTC
jgi:catechol 2,3-dioxygenase-like lactoylglutathione lyase family enzyme